MNKVRMELKVNEEVVELEVAPHWTLLEILREHLGLTGTKQGCGEGVCGSCTVMMDGKPVRACLTLALEASGREVLTVEGSAVEGELDPLQHAFIDKGAVQCGFCTGGMALSIKSYSDKCKKESRIPTRDEVTKSLEGNLCRCTGYVKIIDAAEAVYLKKHE